VDRVYDSTKLRSPAIAEVIELWNYRDLVQLMIINSIKTRYKRSVLGILWTILNPLINTLVLSIALSQLMRGFQVINYPIYLLVGLIFWNFFSQTTVHATNTLIWGSGLVKRIYIPRTIFAVSVVGNGLINILLSFIPLTVIMLAMGHPLTIHALWLPIPLILMVMFTLGVALMISALAVLFVDVVDIYSILLSALFYLTPIIYPINVVPEQFRTIVQWNPMNIMIGLFRSILYSGEGPSSMALVAATLLAFTMLAAGWLVFTKRIDELIYRI
jgi:ABC-type polysaccharide/polyol phosphate export permease